MILKEQLWTGELNGRPVAGVNEVRERDDTDDAFRRPVDAG